MVPGMGFFFFIWPLGCQARTYMSSLAIEGYVMIIILKSIFN